MAEVIVAIFSAIATYALAPATASTLIAVVASAVIGAVVAYAGNALISALSDKPNERLNAADDAKRTIRSAVAPRRVVYGQARVSGPITYAASFGSLREYLLLVIPLADHRINRYLSVWIGETRVDISQIDGGEQRPPGGGGAVVGGKYGASAAVPNVLLRCWKGDQTAADPVLVAESPDGWAQQDRLAGLAYLFARLKFNPNLFGSGVPAISAEIEGKEVYDPRTGATAYSNNWALCVLDYLRSEHGLACSDDEIDFPSFITAANLSDELVQVDANGTTQRRYTLDGTFTLDRKPIEILEEMLAAAGGALVYVAGQYRLYGGAYQAPEVTLTSSDFVAPVEVITKPPRRELFNSVRGTYINPGAYWQASEFPVVQSSAYLAEDGEDIWRELNFAWVIDPVRAQRLGKQLLLRSRQGITVRAVVRYANLNLAVWQTVGITLSDFGWTAKPFRIVAWQFAPDTGYITLTLQEEQPASYAWTWDEAQTAEDPADTTLLDPLTIDAPPGLEASEELYVTRDGAGVRTKALLTWASPAMPFINGFEIEFKEAEATTWRSAGSSTAMAIEVLDLAAGVWDFRVRATSLTGVKGAWAELRRSVGALAAEPPAAITSLTLQTIGGLAFLRWDRATDLDVRVGGRFEIRHTPSTDSPTWSSATSIGEAVPGDATFTVLPLKAGTYFVRAVDAGGIYGPVASINAAQATAISFANVASVTEHSAFTGAKTNTVVASSTLRLDSLGLLDAVAIFDDIVEIDGLGGIAPSGSYTFSGGIDLTTVKGIRLTSRLLATVNNSGGEWDDRMEPIDAWGSIDDTFGGEADAWVEVRQTNDNPGGTPVWSEWRRLDASEYRARAFQFRAQLRSYDPSFNIHISELSVSADEVA